MSMGPVNVGSSIIAFKYKDGVMFAADTAISYGGMDKIKDARRMTQIGEETIIASSGEQADYQNLIKDLQKKQEEDEIENDGAQFLHPREYWNWISRIQYQRRCKNDPLWISTVVGGINKKKNEVFLGTSDFHGMKLEQDFVLTGLSLYMCQVLVQNSWKPDMTYEEGVKLIEQCMRILFIRDKKAHDMIQISTITHEHGVKLGEPFRIDGSVDLSAFYNRTNEFFRPMRIRY